MSFKVNNLLYAAGEGILNTHRTAVTLKDPVDPRMLEEAIRKAAVRYPYFAVRLERQGEAYVMEPNGRPFVLSPAGGTVTLGTEESNGHLFAFAWDGCRFYADASHFVTDGNGIFPFLKTILYYYVTDRYPDAALDPKKFALAGDPVPEQEADDDPYPEEPLPEHPVCEETRPEKIFRPEDQPGGYSNREGWTSFRFAVPQKELMAFASSIDGSPASFIATLLYRAVCEVHPENRLPLVCGMQHQFRKALGRPFSHLSHVRIIPVVYTDAMRGRSLDWLNTATRGTLVLRADDANDVPSVNEHIRNEKAIRGMTLAEKQRYMRKAVLGGVGMNTFGVSYTGRVPWSGLDRYITAVAPYIDMALSGGITAEIFSVGEVFDINIMQRNDDRRYAERIESILRENGVRYTAAEPEPFAICDFRLP